MSAGSGCRNIQKTRPVFASSATTSLIGWEKYITPSATRGVASQFCSDWSAWKTHFCSMFFTLSTVSWVSRLCRWLAYPPE